MEALLAILRDADRIRECRNRGGQNSEQIVAGTLRVPSASLRHTECAYYLGIEQLISGCPGTFTVTRPRR